MTLFYNYSLNDLFGRSHEVTATANADAETFCTAFNMMKRLRDKAEGFTVIGITHSNNTLLTMYYDSLKDFKNGKITLVFSPIYYAKDTKIVSSRVAKKFMLDFLQMENWNIDDLRRNWNLLK